MSVIITGTEPGSLARRARIVPGDRLVAINGNPIQDILDYRFYAADAFLRLDIETASGRARRIRMRKEEYEDPGFLFETYLMDKKHTCRNKCIFCFVDQTPPGMRQTLYFKDDDERLSFLFGNYITLTNLSENEVDRLIRMRISPVNVSVHTMNPQLRVKMMGNPHAGRVLDYLGRLAAAGIRINVQLVLCPGVNDGDELRRSLEELGKLLPALNSVAAAPVGLTRYREGLYPLEPYTREGARAVVETVHEFAGRWETTFGRRAAFPSDEFFQLAELPIPPYAYYEDFPQLDNGVGLIALLEYEFMRALEDAPEAIPPREVSVATGVAAYPLISRLGSEAQRRVAGLTVRVYPIVNDFFGPLVTVAGLVTGQDLLKQLAGRPIGDELLLPQVMLRHERDRFLDDVTVEQVRGVLGTPVTAVENDGDILLERMLYPAAEQAD